MMLRTVEHYSTLDFFPISRYIDVSKSYFITFTENYGKTHDLAYRKMSLINGNFVQFYIRSILVLNQKQAMYEVYLCLENFMKVDSILLDDIIIFAADRPILYFYT